MERQNETAGKTATTNQFDAEIVRLKQEFDLRISEIQRKIDTIQGQNTNLQCLIKANHEQAQVLNREKQAIRKEYKLKVAAVYEKMEPWRVNPISKEHYKRFAAFCELHPEVLAMWREFRIAEEGGAQ